MFELNVWGLLCLLNILMSYFFGYIGLAVSFVSCSIGIFQNIQSWITLRDNFHLAVITFEACILIASVIIAFLTEQDIKNRAKLTWLSERDGLTGLYNDRYFEIKLDEKIADVSKRDGESLILCMIDIDDFKSYNDLYGQDRGDTALQMAGKAISGSMFEDDIACRYDGDKFAVLLPNAPKNDVIAFMENIRQRLYELQAPYLNDSSSVGFTLSMGFSTYPTLADSKRTLLEQADSALYKAKNSGRDTYKMYHDVISEIGKTVTDDKQLTGSIKALLLTASRNDRYTYGHSERVADYAVLIGKAMKLPDEKINTLEIEGLLHDIGKIEIPIQVLNKREPLTEEERNLIKKHSSYSAMIIGSLSSMEDVVEDVKHHHERYDGNGYPDSLKNDDIPLGARILAVADSFDAMQSDRPYRKSLSFEEAVSELTSNAGTQFDPQIVQAFVSKLEHSM